jgi:osmotically-inducible protein OsmY
MPLRTDRPDAEIFADARKALDRCPTVPQGVHVHVHRGMVTLTGSVQRPLERSDAEAAVRSVEGILDLRNDITVTQVPNPEGLEAPDESH